MIISKQVTKKAAFIFQTIQPKRKPKLHVLSKPYYLQASGSSKNVTMKLCYENPDNNGTKIVKANQSGEITFLNLFN